MGHRSEHDKEKQIKFGIFWVFVSSKKKSQRNRETGSGARSLYLIHLKNHLSKWSETNT